jgi:hypothetical protein
MSRWPRLPASGPDRDRLDRAAAAEVHKRVDAAGGKIRNEDRRREPGRADMRVVAGTVELLGLAPPALEQSAAYAAVNTMQAQTFMLTLPDGTKATVPSSGGRWLEKGRHEEARDKQRRSANLPPAPGKQRRGRPKG